MFDITFEDIFAEKLPNLTLLALSADISAAPTCDALWNEVQTMASRIASSYEMSMVNKRPGIAATRAAYKALGKDPNRYRPSTEAMCRRIVRGDGLYRVSNVVDLVNLLSIASGHSIGAFDSDRIAGHTLRLGVGRESEPDEAVHRGPLNIAGLPGLSVPSGFDQAGMPVGTQIIGPALGDAEVLNIGYAFQQATEYHKAAPNGKCSEAKEVILSNPKGRIKV